MDLDVMDGVWFQGSLRLFWGWSWTAAFDERLGANKSDLKTQYRFKIKGVFW